MSQRLYMKTLLSMIVAFVPFIGAAETGGSHGGGGVSTRLDIQAVRRYIYDNCNQWNSATLARAGIQCEALKAKIDEVGISETRLRIEETVIRNGKEYDGWNRCATPEDSDITFSRSRWSQNPDIFSKIGFVTHEYLGCMGIEPTGNYTVSEQLVVELRQKLGPSFQVHPNSVQVDIVRNVDCSSSGTRPDEKYNGIGKMFDRNQRVRFEVRCEYGEWNSKLGRYNDQIRYTYVSSRGIRLTSHYFTNKQIAELRRNVKHIDARCPLRFVVETETGKLLSVNAVCGIEEDIR